MSEEPKDDVAAMTEGRRQIIERIAVELKKINDGIVVENDLDLSTEVEELNELNRKLFPLVLPSREQFEFIEFARKLMKRQGTKMPDFNALYAQIDAMDKKLMPDK